MAALPDAMGISSRDVVLPVVPMFHANGWALAFSTPMAGATLVMPGAKLDGASIYELLDTLQGDLHRRGADGLADAAAASGEDRRQAAAPEARGDRRLGLPARHDADVPGQLRRRGDPRLGHDRDEPARHALHAQAGIRRAHRRGAARRADEAGPSAVRRRDEDHRRRRQASCRGTARPSAGSRCAGRRSRAPISRTTATSSTTRASSTPATSPPSTSTATCRSPTAPRT